MKTTYEKLHKYGINAALFGKAKKKRRAFYGICLLTYFSIALAIQWAIF